MAQPPSQDDAHESSQRQNDTTPKPDIASDEPPLKKPRLAEHTLSMDAPTIVQPNPFLNLPLELLAEIIILTESPKHVLAMARSSKVLCATLLAPSSAYIWRTVRKICKPDALPEPIAIFTEASYAAFVFDEGRCEVCKKKTSMMYTSFALRLRLCPNTKCKESLLDRSVKTSDNPLMDGSITDCVPHAENNRCFLPSRNVASTTKVFRKTDWYAELHRRQAGSSEEDLANVKSKERYISEWMEFCSALHDWKRMYRVLQLTVRDENESWGKALAMRHGWEYHDLIECTPYGAVHRHRSQLLDFVTQRDYDLLASQIDHALVKVSENRKRRGHEAAYKQNRRDVERHYNRLRSEKPAITLPPLTAFRELPIIAMLQGSPLTAENSNIFHTLQTTSWVRDRLNAELDSWVQNAKTELGTILGYSNWKTASTVVLHPCDRVTALFRCKNCPRLPLKYLNDGCLDFRGACAHECTRMSKVQKRHNKTWDPDKFEKDDKAIAIMSRLLDLCGADGGRAEARPLIKKLGFRIICSSCEPPLPMGPESVGGHSHRHSDMMIRLLPETAAEHDFEVGLVQRLLGFEPKAKMLQALSVYGCRHCTSAESESRKEKKIGLRERRTSIELTSSGSKDSTPHSDVKTHPTTKSLCDKNTGAFTFCGLRSHLYAKHKVKDIRDEDIFCHARLDWTFVKTTNLPYDFI